MKRKLMVMVLIAISLTGCGVQVTEVSGDNVTEVEKAAVKPATPVEVLAISSGDISQYHKVSGTIMIEEEMVVVGPTTQGLIQSIHVTEGSWVSAGSLLYKIDTELTEHNLKTQIIATSNAIANAEMTYQTALEAAERAETLYESDVITKVEYDQAINGLESAELNVKIQNDTYDSLVKSLELTQANSYVYAPISGEVSEVNIHVGQGSVGRDIVLTNETAILANTKVPEQVADTLQIGSTIDVGRNGETYSGKITEIDATGNPGMNMFNVEIEVNDPEGKLKTGYTIEVSYPLEHVTDQIIVPRKAIQTDGQGAYVFVVREDRAEKVYVEQGIVSDGQVQIIGEVTPGDQVIVKGQTFLSDGDEVIIIKAVSDGDEAIITDEVSDEDEARIAEEVSDED